MLCVMQFNSILEKYRAFSFSERDKGTRFERLMQAWLQTDPLFKDRFSHVWMWTEFPYRKDFGGKETGIDLVAKTTTGNYWAIQCKCYDEQATIDKPNVDTFLATSSRTFLDDQLSTTSFSDRLWISTTNRWGPNAEETIHNQSPPVHRVFLSDLEQSPVDWDELEKGVHGAQARQEKKHLRPHQQAAVTKCHEHFKTADRGRLIMACGTGKTFTSLKIAEKETNGKGLILFLVPSIALLGQTLREWSAESDEPLNAICVCSDVDVGRKKTKNEDSDGFTVEDLALPASTDPLTIVQQIRTYKAGIENSGMTVVFSTYQSIAAVSAAQNILKHEKGDSWDFDLIVCDEAHRTTGVTLSDEDESAFVRVHDNNFISAKKRLYMTATPRLYSDDTKKKAQESDVYLCSMDDPVIYGEEFYRLGFGEAVEKQLLSDYKVLVLTISDDQIPEALQQAIADRKQEINTDDAAKLIGCINALSKRMLLDTELLVESDPNPMRRAVAFCQNIKISKEITNVFNTQKTVYYDSLKPKDREGLVTIDADHVDGTMGAAIRDQKLSWLKNVPTDGNDCHILCNVRCLSEGIDVPSLDAVLFLSSRNSQIDVVQSVGRVMRTAPGKKYGYIIIPVIVPANVPPEEVLDDNERFKVVWTVLNALRAHDDRFNAMVNKIELNRRKPNSILVGGIPDTSQHRNEKTTKERDTTREGQPEYGPDGRPKFADAFQKEFAFQFEKLQSAIYARMVKKVGDKQYWEQWAASVGDIAKRHIARIQRLVVQPGEHKVAFESFLTDLRKNINPSITSNNAIEMLAQHIITKPVFEALFENYSFVNDNPVSVAMQRMVELLEEQSLEKDQEVLQKFYDSVRMRASGIDNAEGRQRVIIELYDKFFRTAFPKVVEKLGIVYTPVEVVDFIIHSVADVLKKEFGRSLSDENVHILDPFTGTGTFITRLLQSGHVKPEDLERKYRHELHANEIVLLAYYIASINIENAFHDLKGASFVSEGKYESFPGICLTDTFQLSEAETDKNYLTQMFPENSTRIDAQRKAPIRVIIGNPPYSVGQRSANDNAQNQSYPMLETKIEATYGKMSTANLQKSLYDSYIKAFRWASDRLDPQNGGIVAFVSNAGWLDGNAMDGFRKCLEKEFSTIYVFNLRGNCRTSGELRQKEAGNVFGLGSRTPISITLLVKKPGISGKATIYYHDIGDYLSREEKLAMIVKSASVANPSMEWNILHPNKHGDWINQRNDQFGSFISLGAEKKYNIEDHSFFTTYSMGLATNRDAWCYNSSRIKLTNNIKKTIKYYNTERCLLNQQKVASNKIKTDSLVSTDLHEISWTRGLKKYIDNNVVIEYRDTSIINSLYRPFFKQYLYFDQYLNEMLLQIPKLFPTPKHSNLVICVPGVGVTKDFMPLITDTLPDLELIGKSQCFPLYWYEKTENESRGLFDDSEAEQYIRHDAITDFIVRLARTKYGPRVTKEDIFYYVYGFLHSPDYRIRFASDLKKALPRIPLAEKPTDFWAFSKAGRELAELHINYETVEPYPLEEHGSGTDLRVEKMRFPSKTDKSAIIYNSTLTLSGIPARAYAYVVNGKSALEWLMDRYQVTIRLDSKIKNDPNDWCQERGNSRYIVDLIKRIVTVSLKTLDIVDSLPHWEPEASPQDVDQGEDIEDTVK
jgi:predicted helicase